MNDDRCPACHRPVPGGGVCAGPHPELVGKRLVEMSGSAVEFVRDCPLAWRWEELVTTASKVVTPEEWEWKRELALGHCPECRYKLTFDVLEDWCERCAYVVGDEPRPRPVAAPASRATG